MLKPLVLIFALAARVAAQPAPVGDTTSVKDVDLTAYKTQAIAGWTVLVHPEAESADAMRYRRVIAALTFDLENTAKLVPVDALAAIRRVKVVVTPRMGAREGFSGRGMCYHDSAGWLTGHGLDAAREGVVEICNMDDFLTWRAEQPMMTLHELAHAYHAMIGFERADVFMAYRGARQRGLYRGVGYALAGKDEARDAYALNNEREYFAELTEAYFGRNDCFPFVREELRGYDAEGYAVVERLWRLPTAEIDAAVSAGTPSGAVK